MFSNSRFFGRLLVFFLLIISLPKYFLGKIFASKNNNKNDKNNKNNKNISKILVLHNLLLGDAVLILPLLAKLRQNFPNSQIVLALPSAFMELFALSPYNLQIVEFNPKNVKTIANLYKIAKNFDLGILPAENRYSLLLRGFGVKKIIAFEKDSPSWKNFLVDIKIAFPQQNTAFADFILDLLPPELESQHNNKNALIFDKTQWQIKNHSFLQRLPAKKYVVLHLGAGNKTRLWDINSWINLAENLAAKNYEIVFTCGKAEKSLANLVENQHKSFNTDFAGNTTLLELLILLQNSQLIISLDTGIAHLARLSGVANIIIFGPGSAEIYGKNGNFWSSQITKIIAKSDAEIPCRDGNLLLERNHLQWIKHCCISAEKCCQRHNLPCDLPNFISPCMQKISVAEVAKIAISLLENLENS